MGPLIELIEQNTKHKHNAEIESPVVEPTQARLRAERGGGLRFGARLWDLFGNAPIHEAPSSKEEEPSTDKAAIDKMIEDMRAKGHVLERRLRGRRGKELDLHTSHDLSKSREGNRKAVIEEIRGLAGLS